MRKFYLTYPNCQSVTDTTNPFLRAKACAEQEWIQSVEHLSDNNNVLIAWEN